MTNIKKKEEQVYIAVIRGEIEVDGLGRLWRVGKRGRNRWDGSSRTYKCKRVRAERQVPAGYLQVRAMINGTRHNASAHRLVWLHFRGRIPDGLVINHKNGNKSDNRLDNLEVVTPSVNAQHATRILKVGHCANQNGERNYMAKLTNSDVIEIRRRRNEKNEPLKKIADDYGIKFQAVSKIARGDRW